MADRRIEVETETGVEKKTLEFGVSGLLMHSVLVLYDRTDHALWSQLLGEAISGPHAGVRLRTLPVHISTFEEFAQSHPDGEVVDITDTGHNFPYRQPMYEAYRSDPDSLMFKTRAGTQLPPKTPGLGIRAGEEAIFVPASIVNDRLLDVKTTLGIVSIDGTAGGLKVTRAPDDVLVVHTFYFGWSSYYPQTRIHESSEDSSND